MSDKKPQTLQHRVRGVKNPLKDFNKKARRVTLGLAAALSLTCGFNAAAQPLTPRQHPPGFTMSAPAPAMPSVEMPPAPQRPDTTPYKYSDARLTVIKAHMEKTDLGRQLLQFAADEKIAIRMSNNKEMDDNPKDAFTYNGLNFGDHILLNGDTRSDDEIMLTLAHELRHSWHKRIAKADSLDLEPKREWIKDRIEEADAFTFETYFSYEYEKATGIKLKIGGAAKCPGDGYACLVADYRKMRDDGMSAPDAYEKLLEKAFKHVHGLNYDEDFLKGQTDTYNDIVKGPAMGYLYKGNWENPASEEVYTATMRRIVTVGINPAVDTSAFAAWTPLDLASLAKTGGEGPKELKALKDEEDKMAAAKTAYDKYHQGVIDSIREHMNVVPVPTPTQIEALPLPQPPVINLPVINPPIINPPGIKPPAGPGV